MQNELIQSLLKQLEGKDEMIKALLAKIDSLEGTISSLENTVQKMADEMSTLRRMHFGTSSEKQHKDKSDKEDHSDEGSNDISETEPSTEGEGETAPDTSKKRSSKYIRPNRRDYEEIKPEKVIELRPESSELKGARFIKTIESFRFYYIPGKIAKVKIIRHIFEKDGHLITPPLPYAPETFDKRHLDPSLGAWLLTAKYYYHLPYERILKMLNSGGIQIAKTTLFDYAKASIDALDGLYEAIRSKVLSDKRLHIDETVQHLVDFELHHARNVYDWGFISPTFKMMYFSSRDGSRGEAALDEQVAGFNGDYIQSDGYGAYVHVADRLKKNITMVPCMAHVKRKFHDCLQYHAKYAQEALDIINEMFANERFYREKNLKPSEILLLRRKQLRPLLDKFRLWLKSHMDARDYLKEDNLGKAINYAWKRIDGFYSLLRNSMLELSNNLAERTMRGHTVGRRNYLFCQNQDSVDRTCKIYSIIESCKLSGIDPYHYIYEVLSREPKFGETWDDLVPCKIKL